MKYLVTGGAGFIGSHLVNHLIDDGHKVVVWDNYSTGSRENPDALYRNIDVGYLHTEFCDANDFDAIFHLAAASRIGPSFNNPKLVSRSNVMGMWNILEIAYWQNSKVIYAGSSSVYFDKFANPYAFTKQMAEDYCTLYNRIFQVPVAIARFFNVYGQGQTEEGPYANVLGVFEKQKRENKPLTITGDGTQRRDFTHVNDIVSGLIAMSKGEWNAEVFNLGTGVNYSINEVAEMFKQPIEYIAARRGEADQTLADISKTTDLLGWTPQVSLEDYVNDLSFN